jgi:hypothetical protein
MTAAPITEPHQPLLSIPAFWPAMVASALTARGAELYARNLKFIEEEVKIHDALRPQLATPNQVRLDLRTMVLRDYGKPQGIPTLVDAPYAGHTAIIADYCKGQSLIETLLSNGIDHVALTDWKSATKDMKDLEIDNYLEELLVAAFRATSIRWCWRALRSTPMPAMVRSRGRGRRHHRARAGLDAAKYLGTPQDQIVSKTVLGGHIGLFMRAKTLSQHWPEITQWIVH